MQFRLGDARPVRSYFDWLKGRLNINKWEEWYRVKPFQVRQNGGKSILNLYGRSRSPHRALAVALLNAYPEHSWKIWQFDSMQLDKDYWSERIHQQEFMAALRTQFDGDSLDSLYNLKRDLIRQNGGDVLLELYGGSIYKLVSSAYPNYDWKRFRFLEEEISADYFRVPENMAAFMEYLERKIGIQQPNQWYTVSSHLVTYYGGSSLLRLYDNKMPSLLAAYKPDISWDPALFHQKKEEGFWKSKEIQLDFMNRIASQLNVKNLDDWYAISVDDLLRLGGGSVLNYYGRSLFKALSSIYPQHTWQSDRFQSPSSYKKRETLLFSTVQKMFPNTDIFFRYLHPQLSFASGDPMELDIFVPSESLAFEYQGPQHYGDTKYFAKDQNLRVRDEAKRIACESNGITLIEVKHTEGITEDAIKKKILMKKPHIVFDKGS